MTAEQPQEPSRELTGAEAARALDRAFQAVLQRPATRFKLKSLAVRKDRGRIVLLVKFWRLELPPIRLSRAVAESLRLRLNAVLDCRG
jgi:hypothetical protein